MKRILASLMAMMVGTTAATSVVSCGQNAKRHTLDVKIGEKLKYTGDGSDNYKDSDFLQAYNGGGQSVYQIPLTALLYQVWNLFGFDKSQITNSKKIPGWRETYVGMDEIKDGEKVIARPSVDGLYFGSDYERIDPVEFYSYYQQTSINSLRGLWDLYSTMKGKDLSQIGDAARDSYNLVKDVFADGTVGHAFIDSFLSLSNQSFNSSWLGVRVDSDSSYTELDSKVLPFNEVKTGEKDKVTEYQFTHNENPEVEFIGASDTDFKQVNTARDEEGHDNDKVGNRYQAPFDLLILPTTTDVKGSNASFDTNWKYPDKDDKDGQKAINGQEHWDIRVPENGAVDWSFPASRTTNDENVKGYVKTNESVIIPLLPLKLHFTYTTDTKNEKADKYAVDITLDGLQAVFKPVGGISQLKKDEKIANRYMKWEFTNYQFTNQADVTTNPGIKERDQPGFGNYSGMKISSLEVSKMPT